MTDISAMETKALQLRGSVDKLVISNQESLVAGKSYLDAANGCMKMIAEHMDGQIKEAHAKHKKLTTLRTRLLAPYQAVEQTLKGKIGTYVAEERKKAIEAARIKEAEIRKAQDEERLAQAATLEAEGEQQAAEAILEAPMPTPRVEADVPTIHGMHTRVTWKAEVTDKALLIKSAASGDKQAEAALEPNMAILNKLATALKSNMNMPGVKAVKEETLVMRHC